MLKWLLKSLLILIVLVLASIALPLAAVPLCRDPVGGQVFFWVAPWTCAFWSILAYNLMGSKFWRGREAVEEWRARRGGYLCSVAKGTAWMFASLFFSYGCEFGVLWETHSPDGWLPPPISPSHSRLRGAAVGKKPRRVRCQLVLDAVGKRLVRCKNPATRKLSDGPPLCTVHWRMSAEAKRG